ncbi:MAG: hypothetical protein JNL10_13170 [Verrucomicrobiales bacterium]|nr:hypothetical protein [Verrucomicrobiales bacterium]
MSPIDPLNIIQRWCFTLGLAAVVGVAVPLAGPLDPPILEVRVEGFGVNVDQDGGADFRIVANADRLFGFPGTEILDYRVSLQLESEAWSTPLRATPKRIAFRENEEISSQSEVYVVGFNSNLLWMGGYDEVKFPSEEWNYYDVFKVERENLWRSHNELLIGILTIRNDGSHYGWIRFARSGTGFTTPFELVDFSWHPIAGEPIAAGKPPVIRLKPEVTPEGLKVSWPGISTMWILESSASLGADAEWITIPDATSGEVLLPLPETNRFYRLRRLGGL